MKNGLMSGEGERIREDVILATKYQGPEFMQ